MSLLSGDAFVGVGSTSPLTALSLAIRTVYSDEIYLKAMPVMKMEQFAMRKLELGVQPGKTISVTKGSNIKRGGILAEQTELASNVMALTSQDLTVYEYGNAIGLTEYLLRSSFYDQMEAATTMLGRDYAMTVELLLRDILLSATTNILYGAESKTNQTLISSTDYLNTDHVRWAVEQMEVKNAPKFEGDAFIGAIHPHCARYLKKDPDWTNAKLYGRVEDIYIGEIGRFDDVRFFTTTLMPQGADASIEDYGNGTQITPSYDATLANTGVGSAVNLYKSAIFGENAYAYAVSLPVELRDDGVTNFGRFHKLAWYSIMGAGLIEEESITTLLTA